MLTANRVSVPRRMDGSPKRWLWPFRCRQIAGRFRSYSVEASHISACSRALSEGLLRNEAEPLEAEHPGTSDA